MYNLEFQNPVFNRGLNYTVRSGDKWSKRLKIGDWVVVEDDWAVITDVLYTALAFIPQRVYDYEHDPDCHTSKGLMAELERVYGDLEHYVTCVGFVLIKEDNDGKLAT